jgi:hypothetical protein
MTEATPGRSSPFLAAPPTNHVVAGRDAVAAAHRLFQALIREEVSNPDHEVVTRYY